MGMMRCFGARVACSCGYTSKWRLGLAARVQEHAQEHARECGATFDPRPVRTNYDGEGV
jgi:hypothetical protein